MMAGGVIWTKYEDEQLLAMRRDGIVPRKIARSLGRSLYAVYSRVSVLERDLGRTVGRPRTPPDQIIELVRAGRNDHEIAALLGRAVSTVRAVRIRVGLPANTRGGRPEGAKNNHQYSPRP